MDGIATEHSDSDSGESWTLLENSPSYAEEAPEFAENSPKHGDVADNIDKDEDTDGISIISDSDPESPTPSDINYDKCLHHEERPTETQLPNFVSASTHPCNIKGDHGSIRGSDEFLGESKCKMKTYVHRRNKRLSTMLNIIVLGSVITAAGVAIGHMWGARNDCSMHTTPSVNKILSNLYKLQEENAYLRNKLKELTFLTNVQIQRKLDSEKIPVKQHKCKKVFEESLNNKNTNKITKCVDDEAFQSHLVEQGYEKEFLNDIKKLKNVYDQNKGWLTPEIVRRMRNEGLTNLNNLKSPKSITINEGHKLKGESIKRPIGKTKFPVITETVINVTELVEPVAGEADKVEAYPEKRVSYADSLKSEGKIKKKENDNAEFAKKDHERKRKKRHIKDFDTIFEQSASEEDLKKDDRYVATKYKPERKKNDRRKVYKKQKRQNKYEQWEMKGGYMKDYDDYSLTSSQDNEYVLKNPDKNNLARDFERKNYIDQFSGSANAKAQPIAKADRKASPDVEHKVSADNRTRREKAGGKKDKDVNWFEKRASLRSEARAALEQELFGAGAGAGGGGGGGAAPAGWYFRRMQRREQCRVKGDNATYKKLSKRILNFKTKH